ncbi:YkgJ family cysteine cluster protein [Candidatus Woesearchaeota archaeon]|nr:YkgJ family cysteine cluster protein [Candidatus Woesearchaeota archaeon]
MPFSCLHCGACCELPETQIAVTLGDIRRLSRHIGKPVAELFRERIGLRPFAVDGSCTVFKTGLGLRIPCASREGRRCAVYPARPLNCRLFPFHLLARMSQEELDAFDDPAVRCMQGISISAEERGKYRRYVERLADILAREQAATEALLKEHGLLRTVDITTHEDISRLCAGSGRERDRELVRLAVRMIEGQPLPDLPSLVAEAIRRHAKTLADTLPPNPI